MPSKPSSKSTDTLGSSFAYAVGYWNNIRKLFGHQGYISKPNIKNHKYIMDNKSTWSKKDHMRLLYEVAKIDPAAYQSYSKLFSNPAWQEYLPSPTLAGYPEHSKLKINIDKLKSEFKPPPFAGAGDWGTDTEDKEEPLKEEPVKEESIGPPSAAIALSTQSAIQSAGGTEPRALPKSTISKQKNIEEMTKWEMLDRHDEIEKYVLEHQDNPQKRDELSKLIEEQDILFNKVYGN